MILGDEYWVREHPEKRDWWKDMRRVGRFYAANPILWRLASNKQPSKMTDEAYSLLELRWALAELRKHDYEAWHCITRTDMSRPPVSGGLPRVNSGRVADLIGKSEASVYRARRRGWEWIASKVVDDIAPVVVEQMGRDS